MTEQSAGNEGNTGGYMDGHQSVNKVGYQDWIVPDWPAPKRVRSLITTRSGGVSEGGYASLNLGDHVGDALIAALQKKLKTAQA